MVVLPGDTVDGQFPALVATWFLPLFIGWHPSQVQHSFIHSTKVLATQVFTAILAEPKVDARSSGPLHPWLQQKQKEAGLKLETPSCIFRHC